MLRKMDSGLMSLLILLTQNVNKRYNVSSLISFLVLNNTTNTGICRPDYLQHTAWFYRTSTVDKPSPDNT